MIILGIVNHKNLQRNSLAYKSQINTKMLILYLVRLTFNFKTACAITNGRESTSCHFTATYIT